MLTATAVASVAGAGATAAAAATEGFDPMTLIGTAVTPVVVVLLIVTGWLHPKGTVDRLQAALDAERAGRAEERADRIALQTTLTEQVVPELTRSHEAITRSTELLEAMARRQVGGG